ncbi:MAG TPA: hypothetical protein VFL38_10180, partial [Humibacillus xanthopallidus]|nr:hypothetical protein [Humibacillus xanthopallidus]
LARDLIIERVAARHRAQRRRHPSRTAGLLRSLADRLDHTDRPDSTASDAAATAAPRAVAPAAGAALHEGPHAGQPRPWSATVRRAPHRHTS